MLFEPLNSTTHRSLGIIWTHGGPSGQVTVAGPDLETIELFCAFGFTVLAPNFRGSTGYGQEFEDLNNGDWGGGDLLDVQYAQAELSRRLSLPANRVGVVGHSYGGYLAAMAATQRGSTFGFGVAINGITDLIYEVDHGSQTGFILDDMGDYHSSPAIEALYRERSPIQRVTDVTKPILLIAGQMDTRVPIQQSRDFTQAAQALGKPITFVELPSEGHNLAYIQTKQRAFQAILDFLWGIENSD